MLETDPEGEDAVVECEAKGADAEDDQPANGGGEAGEDTVAVEETSGGIGLVPAADDDEDDE